MPSRPTLPADDRIVTAWAESAGGPGWGNTPVWVLIRSGLDGSHRVECLQPDEQTETMMALYRVSEATHAAMMREASEAMTRKQRGNRR